MSSSDYERIRDKRDEELRNDPRSIEELLPLALAEMEREDSDEYEPLDAIAILQSRGSKEVFEVARKLCNSEDPKERSLGATLLGQNCVFGKNFPDEKFEILFELLENETDTKVLSSACFALGHINDPRAIPRLVKLKNHPSVDVRYSVVHGLLTHDEESAIAALIELSEDEDEDVRDWATFGLGRQISTNPDTYAIREALFKRISDEHDDTRFEGLVGLVRRNDERVLDLLLEELYSDDVGLEALDIAADSENPVLCQPLLALKERWQGREDEYTKLLERAVWMCECDVVSTNEAENSVTEK